MLEPLRTAAPHPLAAMRSSAALVAAELAEVEGILRRLLLTSEAVLPEVGEHLLEAGGKRLRPLITLLAAAAADAPPKAALTVAAVGELLHTATLLHDDVVDTGDYRRGRPSARYHFGNGPAVLVGDFCLARAMVALAETRNLAAICSLTEIVAQMAQGEIAQLAHAGSTDLNRARYYAIIDNKTAVLFAWCAAVGTFVPPALVTPLRSFGRELGFAFQIADDILDYTASTATSGKTPARDLRDGKVTLPLILACELDHDLVAEIDTALRRGPPLSDAVLLSILDRVAATDALHRATEIAEAHAEAAIRHLCHLPPSPAHTALIEVARGAARRAF